MHTIPQCGLSWLQAQAAIFDTCPLLRRKVESTAEDREEMNFLVT
jgi:hypothetical protein